MIINSGREIFDGFSPYDVLRDASGLVVDVGAAAGAITRKILSYSSTLTCIAVEPFSGNHPYFIQNIGGDSRVKLVKKALGDFTGLKRFKVGALVSGNEVGWQNYVGYSSGGRIVSDESVTDGTVPVDVIRLDDLVEEPPLFVKIDVQGGELDVLKGSECLMEKGIPYFYIEYSGQPGLVEHILKYGYIIYDTEHLIVPRAEDDFIADYQLLGFKILSSGRKAYFGHPLSCNRDPSGFEQHFIGQRPRRIAAQTDIFCIHKSIYNSFIKIREILSSKTNRQHYFNEM